MSSFGPLPSSLVIFGSKFCRSSAYLLSQPLCPAIEAAPFAWPGFLLGQRHRPIMPWYRRDFPGLPKWIPMPFPSRIEHCGPLGAIKKKKGDLHTLRTDQENSCVFGSVARGQSLIWPTGQSQRENYRVHNVLRYQDQVNALSPG